MEQNRKETFIDETKRRLITAGAAVAANGGEILKSTLSELMKAGVPKEKADLAISIGHTVKERPAAHMMAVADVLVDTDFGVEATDGCSADRIASAALCRRTVLLVAAGSAMAANCEPCLNMLVPRLIEAGVSDTDIRTAVLIGKETRDAITAETFALATTAIGGGKTRAPNGCGCLC